MPLYEYTCRTCNEEFDTLRNVNDLDSEVECPVCGNKNASRRMSLSAVAKELFQKVGTANACPSRKYG